MLTIYGDMVSGNCLKVKYVCDLLDISYEWRAVDVVGGEAKSDEFLAINPFGQVPAVKFGDGQVLTQSNAIMRHLARDSRLVPEDSWLQAKMDEWLFWEQYSHETAIAVLRFHVLFKGLPVEKRDAALVQKGEAALDFVERTLSKADWLVGSGLSLADLSLFAYTQFASDGGFSLSGRPGVQAWLERVRSEIG